VLQCPAPGVNWRDNGFCQISTAGKFNLYTARTLGTLKSIGIVGPHHCGEGFGNLSSGTEEMFTVIYLIIVSLICLHCSGNGGAP